MKEIIFTISLFIICVSTFAQDIEIKSCFKDGQTEVQILDSIVQPERLTELSMKFMTSVQDNYKWFLKYQEKHPEKPMPFHKNFGITEAEYKEIQQLSGKTILKSSSTVLVNFIVTDSIIAFEAPEELAILNFISIDINKSEIKFNDYLLTEAKNVEVHSTDNAFESPWKGKKWEFTYPENIESVNFSDLENLSVKIYQITIGQLKSDGSVVMILKGQEVESGLKTIQFEIPIKYKNG